MKTIGVLTSGGDAPGMNAAVRAVARTGENLGIRVMGIRRGYEGLMDGDLFTLTRAGTAGIMHQGGTILKTARSAEFMTEKGFGRALDTIRRNELDGLVVIGGDGSYHGALKLSRCGITVVGIPGTIDNDMGYTDFTIGFDTAVNTVLDAIGRIKDTGSAHDKTTIIEVMGRNCGDIALYSGLTGGAEFILIPELDYDLDDLCENIRSGITRGKNHCIIIKAEGVKISTDDLARVIEEKTGQQPRKVILGYLQRGGSPSARDRLLATQMGSLAVKLIGEDAGSCAIGITGNEMKAFELDEAVSTRREADLELIELMRMLR